MRIVIIGAGRMGQALARLFAGAGHEVVLSNSRGPKSLSDLVAQLGAGVSAATVADAVADAGVVVLATPWTRNAEALGQVRDWSGKILIDTTNNRTGPGPDAVIDLGDRLSSAVVAQLAPGARVVKAFNTTGIPVFAAGLGEGAGEANAMYVAGDDEGAKAVVSRLIADIKGEAVDTGDLRTGGRLQGMGGPLAGHQEMLTPEQARARLADAKAALSG